MGRYSSLTVVGALAGLDTVDTAQIDDDAVTYAKVQNVAADDVLLGRISGADGVVEEITKAQALTLLSVADGADVTGDNAPQSHEVSHKSSGSDEILLDELGTPTDVATLNSSISAHGLLKKLDNSATNFMNGQGNWAEPAGSNVSAGSYTGNDSVNRAVAHSLGLAPKIVFFERESNGTWTRLFPAAIITTTLDIDSHLAVTAMDTTNFYVGNATSYGNSANGNTITYNWVAIA